VEAGSLYGGWRDGGNALAGSEAEGADDSDHGGCMRRMFEVLLLLLLLGE